eukprot:Skav227042  [mRNA]  locus=scaffold72:508971:509333:- [translate_table: standard]
MGGEESKPVPPPEQPMTLKRDNYNNCEVHAESRKFAERFASACLALAIGLAFQMPHMKKPACSAVTIVAALAAGGFAVREATKPNITQNFSMEVTGTPSQLREGLHLQGYHPLGIENLVK